MNKTRTELYIMLEELCEDIKIGIKQNKPKDIVLAIERADGLKDQIVLLKESQAKWK